MKPGSLNIINDLLMILFFAITPADGGTGSDKKFSTGAIHKWMRRVGFT
jgi:hypothetical protein